MHPVGLPKRWKRESVAPSSKLVGNQIASLAMSGATSLREQRGEAVGEIVWAYGAASSEGRLFLC